MNVVRREKARVTKPNNRRNDNSAMGILATYSYNHVLPQKAVQNVNVPKYNTSTNESKRKSMGPPTFIPSSKRRNTTSSSYRTDLSTSIDNRVLANESAKDSVFMTPVNKPNALRYISSSSKGGTHTRSARSTTTTTNSSDSCVILAISEGRGMARGEVGMAAIDLKHPNLVLCQLSDSMAYTNTLTKINFFNPVEIIVPHTFCDGQSTTLFKIITSTYPSIPIQKVQRRHYNDTLGLQQIQNLCAPQYNGVYMLLVNKFYALTAAAALLKYVEYIQCVVFAQHSLKVEYNCSDQTMLIDICTAEQLELVQPLDKSAGMQCCLLGVLGPVLTSPGARLMRATILQPSCNREMIEARLDCVQELIENDQGLLSGIQNVLKKLNEVDRILFLCVEPQNQELNKMCEAQLNQTLILKTTMALVPSLLESLGLAESGRFRKIKLDLENPHYEEILGRIKNILMEDAHMEKGVIGTLQRCFAIKPDINGLLDVARRTYSELIDEIQKLVDYLSETHGLQLRLNQNMTKGFHIVLPIPPKERRLFSTEDLPDVFIQVQNNGTNVTMTTEDLVMLDQQARESLSEIQNMSNIVIIGLLRELRPFMGSLYTLCEHVAELDLLVAFAQTSIAGSYIRPMFNNYLDVREGVHPLLEYNSHTNPVSNNIFASPEYNFTIITGPNMGGKSIYIKQVAILHIMAQIGCFLPATNAVFRITDQIFARMGFNDSVELNASTYVLEMKEMQYILKNITPTSLVIIDELCRGTSCDEGASIAWAMCEELMQKDAFIFFTTHFLQLTKLQDLYHNVVNLCTVVHEEGIPDTDDRRLVYKHRIESGVTNLQHYGLNLAKKTNIPPITLELAQELAEVIANSRKPGLLASTYNKQERMLYKLSADIRMAARKADDATNAISEIINKFKRENQDALNTIKEMLQYELKSSTTVSSNPATTDSNKDSNIKSNQKDSCGDKENLNSTSKDISSSNAASIQNNKHDNSHNSEFSAMNNDVLDFDNFMGHNTRPNRNSNVLFPNNLHLNDSCNTAGSSSFLSEVQNLPPKIVYSSDQNNSMFEIETADSNRAVIKSYFDQNAMTDASASYCEDDTNEHFNSSEDEDISEVLTQILDQASVENTDYPVLFNSPNLSEELTEESMVLTKESSLESYVTQPSNSSDCKLFAETVDEINREIFQLCDDLDEILLPPPEQFRD